MSLGRRAVLGAGLALAAGPALGEATTDAAPPASDSAAWAA